MQEYETSGSDGAGTAYPSGAPVFTPVFVVFDYIYMHNMSDNI
jgi:hypothetical protein